MKSRQGIPVSSCTPHLLYGSETWSLLAYSLKRTKAFETKYLRKLLPISYLEYETSDWVRTKTLHQCRLLGAEQGQVPCGPKGTFSGNCLQTETCMVRACDMPRQPLQNHPSGYLGGRLTLWSAEDILGGQRDRVDTPAHARSAMASGRNDWPSISAESSIISSPPKRSSRFRD